MWFTPLTELLPIDGKFWPIQENWEDSHASFLTTLGFGLLGYLYPALALAGIWATRRSVRTGSGEFGASRLDGRSDKEDPQHQSGTALHAAHLPVHTAFLPTWEA